MGELTAFLPLIEGQPRVLILGTFPSPVSREKREYYGNPRNQFWKIVFDAQNLVFDNPSYDEKKAALFKNGIALWDVIASCEADSALDTSIRNPVYNTRLPMFIAENKITAIFFNGGNAYRFCKRGIGTIDGMVLPSTSPANARLKYPDKLLLWSEALREALADR
ncbi:MAG: DNA-deoxyinosine glycosylase [Clostridiales bacterium]|nr:DNA-deoxyinosine glycosylase [Clostridiales bacterium]